MTPKVPAYTAPACRIDEHAECHGPGETRLPWQSRTGPAIETLRCDCPCHTTPQPHLNAPPAPASASARIPAQAPAPAPEGFLTWAEA
ncbi:hypothetical protein [Streptomyces scopuliridis]|uniref:Uncharacterized protein n=1 Tax=Streptomyces scopuliridis RB72 TaxID=1440053 RepID=A0A2T7TBK6_9ACTN|nr:hypothetical protein [Streptomyces scopuliridis]PVE12547.1 hypothetical protein Y717_32200 [Streptomyces scopuliridis RB72]